jgi:hypothetical protein
MKLKEKFKFILPILIIILAILSYNNFIDGTWYKSQIPEVDSEDKIMMAELDVITENYPINTIDVNVKNFIITLKEVLLNVKVVNTEDDSLAGVDKVGEFRDLIIYAEGDYLSQAYLLKEINENMRNFVLINEINANNNKITIKARVYGKTH